MPSPVLTIGGTDPCGAFGLSADLKCFSAVGGYGMGVVTVVTAQNSRGFYGAHPIPPEIVAAQLTAVLEDYAPRVVKTGFLGRVEVVQVVGEILGRYAAQLDHILIDPVLVNGQGDPLFPPEVTAAYRTHLLPLADWLLPNRAEAALLLGQPTCPSPEEATAALHELLPAHGRVWLKQAVQTPQIITDWLFDGHQSQPLTSPRIATPNTAGSGDRLSAVLAVMLTHGLQPPQAAVHAHRYLQSSLYTAAGWELVRGRGPSGI
ncbi:MAG: bifunctional hydroxymethylpyrimidine kinase/phosphomethylpyrimidine kinase [Chloroflexi bacterium]|nr:bifunctional hydroxymethylpyrimidine kinase/phosphomethylpyrimidine kinase [Chloroflexota bacterium]